MPTALGSGAAVAGPLRGELRYGLELLRLLSSREFLNPGRRADQAPVLLVPGFLAGDGSLRVLAGWLRRRGARVGRAGIFLNSDCAERAVTRIEHRIRALSRRSGKRVALIGQSRGGGLARVAAVRNPDLVGAVVMLGAPVRAPLDVGPATMRTVRSIAWLGDHGVPGMLSSECRDGACCERFRSDITAPLPDSVRGISIYSRSDGIVSWTACLDPYCDQVEVESSHTGMSVNADVYRVLARVLDEEVPWTG